MGHPVGDYFGYAWQGIGWWYVAPCDDHSTDTAHVYVPIKFPRIVNANGIQFICSICVVQSPGWCVIFGAVRSPSFQAVFASYFAGVLTADGVFRVAVDNDNA